MSALLQKPKSKMKIVSLDDHVIPTSPTNSSSSSSDDEEDTLTCHDVAAMSRQHIQPSLGKMDTDDDIDAEKGVFMTTTQTVILMAYAKAKREDKELANQLEIIRKCYSNSSADSDNNGGNGGNGGKVRSIDSVPDMLLQLDSLRDNEEETPLQKSIDMCLLSAFGFMISIGVNVHVHDAEGLPMLYHALLISSSYSPVEYKGKDLYFKFLLNAGADIDEIFQNNNILNCCIMFASASLLQMLLEKGVNTSVNPGIGNPKEVLKLAQEKLQNEVEGNTVGYTQQDVDTVARLLEKI
jgi:hypothetical protein